MYASNLSTPIGNLLIEANEEAVFSIEFKEPLAELPNELTVLAKVQLEDYFNGKTMEFVFPMQQPGSDFQQAVWQELLQIKAGYPISYAALSQKMNNPLAIRAIAATNGKNKLAIVVPCHRVIGSNGDLVGYAGGLWRKQWLLNHEAQITGIGQTSLFL
ncbi:MAG: methylated-DNA--[protein]-cysteine S-methyltransferase [Sphingobacteriaceae bacterium]